MGVAKRVRVRLQRVQSTALLLPVRDVAVVRYPRSSLRDTDQALLKLVEKGDHISREGRIVYFKYHRPRVRPIMQDGHCIGLSGYAYDFIQRDFESLGRRQEIDVGGCNDELAYRLQRQVLLLDDSALERTGTNGTALHQG